jgi:hypothetical protein
MNKITNNEPIYKALHRKLQSEQHEPTKTETAYPSGAPEFTSCS